MAIAPAAAGALSHDPRRDDPAPPPVLAGWALFETRVDREHLPMNTATAAACKTSNGRDVRVSLRRLATPPACSVVQLYTDDDVPMVPISVVAADGDLLLVHMVVAVKGVYAKKFPHNFFVYKADPELPSLLPLPPPPSVWKAQAEVTGIARRGEEFVVANLRRHNVVVDATTMTEVEAAVVWLYRSSSATGQWETKQLDLPYAKEEGIVEYFLVH